MKHSRTYSFGPFVLVPERQLLLQHDRPVRIGCRALDLLTALVERPGELVTKRELMARAWPSTTVEECNLKVNIATLRRALGEDAGASGYVATVTGRGYRFAVPVETGELLDAPAPAVHHRHDATLFEALGRAIVDQGIVTLQVVHCLGCGACNRLN